MIIIGKCSTPYGIRGRIISLTASNITFLSFCAQRLTASEGESLIVNLPFFTPALCAQRLTASEGESSKQKCDAQPWGYCAQRLTASEGESLQESMKRW